MNNVYDPTVPTTGIYSASADVQAHIRALRIRIGTRVRVLNGLGLAVECRMIDATRFEVMHVESETYPVPRILGIGVLENRDRMEFAVEKAVELGATHIIPLITDHSGFARTTSNRLVAKAIAALTQCGRLWLPEIHAPTLLHDALRWAKESFNAHLLYGVASESGSSPIKNVESEPVMVVVGPEGGLSSAESERLRLEGAAPIGVGHKRLRSETAAIAILAMLESNCYT